MAKWIWETYSIINTFASFLFLFFKIFKQVFVLFFQNKN